MRFNHTMIFFNLTDYYKISDITNFVLIIKLEKDRSMIETHCIKNFVVFIQKILCFVLSRKIIKH